MRYFIATIMCMIGVCTLFMSYAHAGDKLPKKFKTTHPEKKSVTMEDVYYYYEMKYDPPVKVPLYQDRESASYDTPEEAAISYLSAWMSGDYQWYLNSWTEESKETLLEEFKEKNMTPESWSTQRKKYSAAEKEEEYVFTHRIETGNFVIIGYEINKRSGDGKSEKYLEWSMVFKRVGNKWLGTRGLGGDPVLRRWRTPDKPEREIKRREFEDPKENFEIYKEFKKYK